MSARPLIDILISSSTKQSAAASPLPRCGGVDLVRRTCVRVEDMHVTCWGVACHACVHVIHPAGINGVGHGVQHDCGERGPLGPRLAIWQMCIVFGLASFASARGAHGAPGEAVARQERGERVRIPRATRSTSSYEGILLIKKIHS